MFPETSTYMNILSVKGEKARKGMNKSFTHITSNFVAPEETLQRTSEFPYQNVLSQRR